MEYFNAYSDNTGKLRFNEVTLETEGDAIEDAAKKVENCWKYHYTLKCTAEGHETLDLTEWVNQEVREREHSYTGSSSYHDEMNMRSRKEASNG